MYSLEKIFEPLTKYTKSFMVLLGYFVRRIALFWALESVVMRTSMGSVDLGSKAFTLPFGTTTRLAIHGVGPKLASTCSSIPSSTCFRISLFTACDVETWNCAHHVMARIETCVNTKHDRFVFSDDVHNSDVRCSWKLNKLQGQTSPRNSRNSFPCLSNFRLAIYCVEL